METRRSDGDSHLTAIRFSDLRDDWYRGVDLMVRLIARAAAGEPIVFEGFPRQWLPIFVLWRVRWSNSVLPPQQLPLVTDLTEDEALRLIEAAEARGQLRTFVEAWVSLDPLLADVLHRLDRRAPSPAGTSDAPLPLTGWQSYGRAEVRDLDACIAAAPVGPAGGTTVLLPCARGRPYDGSRTHKRIWRALDAHGVDRAAVDPIVISSIGVVPEAFWTHPVVLAYDSGVPDIWRVLRLMRTFFGRARFARAYDCLQFAPYSEAIRIIVREGLIGEVVQVPVGKPRKLPAP
ncbi:MAG: DUF5591 domain-containing protein [Blastomonas fulva]